MCVHEGVVDLGHNLRSPGAHAHLRGDGGAFGEGQAAQRDRHRRAIGNGIRGQCQADGGLGLTRRQATGGLDRAGRRTRVRAQVGVEGVAVQVSVRCGRSPAGQGLEGVAAGQQEGHGSDRVRRVGLQWLTVDRHRRDALPVGPRRIVGVAHVRGQAELEHRTRVLRVQVGLPLLLERVLDVRSLERHVPQLVGEGLDLVGLRVGNRAILVRHQVGAQAARVNHADVDALSVRGEDGFAQRVGHQVTQGGLDASVRARVRRPLGGREDAAPEGLRVTGGDDTLAGFL